MTEQMMIDLALANQAEIYEKKLAQLRAGHDLWKSVVEGVNKTLGATTTTDALMKLAQLRAENAEMREALESMVGRFGGSSKHIFDTEAINKARAVLAKYPEVKK